MQRIGELNYFLFVSQSVCEQGLKSQFPYFSIMDGYLQYLIHEEIYLVKEDKAQNGSRQGIVTPEKELPLEKLFNKTILLISHDNPEMLPPKIQDLLINILRAISLTLDEIIMININQEKSEEEPLANYQIKECKIVGFLDSIPAGCQDVFDTQKYTLYHTGSFTSMLADPLEEIDQDRSKKVILWEKLKELYHLR